MSLFKIILLQYLTIIISSLIKFHFNFEKNLSLDIISQLIESNMTTNIKVGNPVQNIITQISFDDFSFYISNKQENSYYSFYNNKTSSSLKIINNENIEFDDLIGKKSEEKFYFMNEKNKEKEINNLLFILSERRTYKNIYPSGIGCLIREKKENDINFFHELKSRNIIKNKTFNFVYSNINEGEMIIGNYPHEYNSSYNIKNFVYSIMRYTYMIDTSSTTFSDLITYNKSIDTDYDIEFDGSLYGIFVHFDYLNFIKEQFFDEYIQLNKCNYYNTIKYRYFICDNDINISKFQSLIFISKVMNMSFILNYNDLFYKYENKYIFLAFVNNYISGTWRLGRIFMKKYHTIFDIERGIVGFYKEEVINQKRDYFKFIMISILICIIGFLLFKYYNVLKKNRKIRVNEIEENFDYTPQKI